MRRTKAKQLVAIAAAIAAPSLIIGGIASASDVSRFAPRAGTSASSNQAFSLSNTSFKVQQLGTASGYRSIGVNGGGHVTQVTDSTYIGDIGSSWSVAANWSPAVVPNGVSDVARFTTLVDQTSTNEVDLDINVQLQQMFFNSVFTQQIANPAVAQHTITLSGGTVTVSNGPTVAPTALLKTGAVVGVQLGGTGLTKEGTDGLILLDFDGATPGASTFTGTVNVKGGQLSYTSDALLGNASNSIALSNGAELNYIGGSSVANFRPIAIGTGGATMRVFAGDSGSQDMTIAADISGSAPLAIDGFTGSRVDVQFPISYSGTVSIKDLSSLSVSSSGSMLNVGTIENGGGLFLANGGNHIGNATQINSYGGLIVQSTQGVSETVGVLSLRSGDSNIIIADTTGPGSGSIIFSSIDRQNHSILNLLGKNLGGGANSGNVVVTAAPTLTGGGGLAGSTNISIVPWMFGDNTDTTGSLADAGLITYNSTTKTLRTLTAAEYQTSLTAAAATDNVQVVTAQTVNGAKTINALVLGPQSATVGGSVAGTGVLTITSGAVICNDTSSDATGAVIAKPIAFPTEGILSAPNGFMEIDGRISGATGGLTLGQGEIVLTAANTYTGPTTVMGLGTSVGNVLAGASSPFGNVAAGSANDAIIVRHGAALTDGAESDIVSANFSGILAFEAAASTGFTFSRAITYIYDPAVSKRQDNDLLAGLTTDGGPAAIFSGPISINTGFVSVLTGGTAAPGALDLTKSGMTISSVVSGGGGLEEFESFDTDATGPGSTPANTGNTTQSVIRLAGNNTYTGGTVIKNAIWQASSANAFGTGSITFDGDTPLGPDGTTPITAGPLGRIQAFGAPVTLNNYILYNTSGGFAGTQPLTLSGTQDLGSAITQITQDSTADVTISGTITRGGFAKAGTGRLILTGSNNYTGQTQVNAGVLNIRNNNALGTGQANLFSASYATALSGTGVLEIENNITTNESIFFTGATSVATGNIRNVSGTNTIGGQVGIAPTGNIGVNAGSTLNVTGDVFSNVAAGTTTFASLNKVGTGRLNIKRAQLTEGVAGAGAKNGGINVQAGTLGFIANGTPANVNVVRTLAISGSAFVDLTNNDLIVSATPKATVVSYVAAGYNFGGFDGVGGMSTSSGLTGAGNTALGVLDANEYANNNGSPTFDGVTVGANDVLVKYTYFGDVDFNGAVDSTDYNIIDFGFLTGASGWANGDVDYNGAVDSTDYNSIDFAFVTQSGALRRAISYLDGTDRSTKGMGDPSLQEVVKHYDEFGNVYAAGFLAHVPEPTSLGVVGLAAGALMGRRRRRAAM